MKKCLGFIILLIFFVSNISACKAAKVDKSYASYQITANFNEESMTIDGTLNLKFKNTTDKEITALKFNLYPNAYRDGAKYNPIPESYHPIAYEYGESFGKIAIEKVLENKQNAEIKIGGIDQNILQVDLNKSLFPGESAVFEIEFITKLAKINHTLGYTQKTVSLSNWYPLLCVNTNEGYFENVYYFAGDPFYSDSSDYDITFSLPSSYTVAASAKAEGVEYAEDIATYHYTQENLRGFALVLSKDFNIKTITADDIEITYYYIDECDSKQVLDAAKTALQFFSNTFISYPYGTFNIVKVPLCVFGAENSCLAMLSDSLDGQNLVYEIVCQTAHQWWSQIVGNNQGDFGWLDEGLSAVSSLVFFERHKDFGVVSKSLTQSAKDMYKEYIKASENVNTSMNKRYLEYESRFEYINITQNKSLLMLDTARLTMGDEKFLNALKKFSKKYAFKNADGDEFIGVFEKSRLDVEKYFYSWIYGDVII